ncbi:MAG: hypothetical protein CALGDGBN_00814 [Pseudomonadales bacterium]|nr:hypothetical protein [Pseudomonadales bacterium]
MYQHYFGLRALPFSIAPDPHYLYLSNQHREALAHLLYGVGASGGFVLLTGEVGTGKTTVCRCLLQQLPEKTELALIVNPRQSPAELLASICDELGVARAGGQDTVKHHTERLMRHLLEAHARGYRVVVVIDEAQNLAPEVLEQLRLLTNLETNERKLLQLILLAQPEMNALLARPDMRQFEQRITARYHLRALDLRDTRAYINHRLAVAGMYQELFPPWAVRRLYAASTGVPRVLNVLCDRVLLGVYGEGARSIARRHVRAAIREVRGEAAAPVRRRWPWFAALGAAVLSGSIAGTLALRGVPDGARVLVGGMLPADTLTALPLGAGLKRLLEVGDGYVVLARVEYFRAHAGLPPGGGVDRDLLAALAAPGGG